MIAKVEYCRHFRFAEKMTEDESSGQQKVDEFYYGRTTVSRITYGGGEVNPYGKGVCPGSTDVAEGPKFA